MNKVVILHACPPALANIPLASLTALKCFLTNKGFDAKIIYWNLIFRDLQSAFLFEKGDLFDSDIYSELLFLNYIAISNNDSSLYNKVKLHLASLHMQSKYGHPEFLDKHMHAFKIKTENLIYRTIEDYHFQDALCFGFSLKLDQWLFSSILGNILKQLYIEKHIIVGGINTKDAALSILENFKSFDIALWGEGENQLLQIVEELYDGQICNWNNIPYSVFRMDGKIVVSKSNIRKYVDLSNSTFSDFSDYFCALEKTKTISRAQTQLPIEGSRGCHWGKCHFCYLNIGYKYRLKSVETIKAEILSNIEKYNISNFIFLDNDLTGVDLIRFNKLLDCFVEIRKIYPNFKVVSAEIITKGLDRSTIMKMALGGVISVQIGWESTSDNLLTKIEKKNTFASNIYFLKIAAEANIRITGMNVIANLPEETEDDIFEAINNVKFFRFSRNHYDMFQIPSRLTINSTSKYLQKKNGINRCDYMPIKLMHKCIAEYISTECAWNILDYWLPYRNDWWDLFDKTELYYRKNKHSYRLSLDGDNVVFKEFVNFKECNTLKFIKNSLEYQVFSNTNDPISLEMLCNSMKFPKQQIIDCLDYYFRNGLIYHNKDYTEIVSTINFKFNNN